MESTTIQTEKISDDNRIVLPGLKVVDHVDLQKIKEIKAKKLAEKKKKEEEEKEIELRGKQLLANADTFHQRGNMMLDIVPVSILNKMRQMVQAES